MRQDLLYAVRLLRRAPGFAVVAITTLAVAIGANTAIFATVRAALLAPLPFPDADRLVEVWEGYPPQLPRAAVSAPGFLDIRESHDVFTDAAAIGMASRNLTGSGEPERVLVARVSQSFQSVLGTTLALGRWFTEDEDVPNQNDVVVLSDGLWRRRFGGDRSIVGRMIVLNDRPHQVVGVMAAASAYPRPAEAWIPIAFTAEQRRDRGSQYLDTIARLRPDVPLAQARAALEVRTRALRTAHYADSPRWTLDMHPLRDEIAGSARAVLLASLGAVGLVLLIACANVANLLLARGADRRRELAVRAALGAGPARLRRQLLAEAAVLGGAGTLGGVAVALAALPVLAPVIARTFPALAAPRFDGAVFAFVTVAAIASTVVFGVLPAWQGSRLDLRASMTDGARGPAARRARRAFVVGELAMAFALLVASGLLVRSFARILAIDPGFRVDRQLTMRVALPASRYASAGDRAAFWARLLDRLSAAPGAEAAAAVSELPLSDLRNMGTFEIAGRTYARADLPHANIRSASPRYFEAMGIRLLAGRPFADRDAAESAPVAVIDDLARARYWPAENPIGRRLSFDGDDSGRPIWCEIVGVVQTVHHDSLEETVRPTIYVPFAQRPPGSAFAVVRAGPRVDADPLQIAGSARAAVRAIDPQLPIFDVRTMDGRLSDSMGARRIATTLIATFGGIAVALALVGIYGVVSYDVGRRSKEIALRMAIGASRANVLGLVLGGGLRLGAAGVVFGALLAAALARAAGTLLFGVSPFDVWTYVTLAAALLAVTVAATWLPARRAANVDPSEMLRET